MRAPFIVLLILLIINAAIDAYIYIQSRRRCHNQIWGRLQLFTAIFLAAAMIVEMSLPAKRGDEMLLLGKMWLLFAYLSIYLPKYLAVAFDLVSYIPKLWKGKRLKAVTCGGIVVAIITFAALWWGALINRYQIHVNEVGVSIPSLPKKFDGLRIAQFSDLHTGTFNADTTFVSRLVDKINSLKPDVIVFTGDIVNRRSDEMAPFTGTLSRLHAPMGVYAVLGNHDYGDYWKWESDEAKQRNMQILFGLYDRTGIRLLRNQTAWLRSGNDSIALIGVENIGDPPFKTYGSLLTAYPTPEDSYTKILLSHNPQHWVDSISGRSNINIPLTLSGHTHAMQIEACGISPAVFRYDTWGGLYHDIDNRNTLYVNIGAGTVGIPMRVGATPEITLLTLKAGNAPQ